MDQQSELAIIRRAYAKQILAAAGVADARIEQAFATIPREHFLGSAPWSMCRPLGNYIETPSPDPACVYVDQVFGLVPEFGINNGQPSLHALLIAAARIQEGEHIVHVGAGTGYYSAIMAQLAGPDGRVTAIECDSLLARRARECLSGMPNVEVIEADGTTATHSVADVIYVNAGVTHPAGGWLDALSEQGRLILPLTTDENFPTPGSTFDSGMALRSGAHLRIQRCGKAFNARGLLPTALLPAQGAGARNRTAEAALAAAFRKGGWHTVTRLVRNEDVPENRCWLKGNGWCLI